MTLHPAEQPDCNPPASIMGMEQVIRAIGPSTVARVLGIAEDSPISQMRRDIVSIENGTTEELVRTHRLDTYGLVKELGQEILATAMGVPLSSSEEELRSGIVELERRSLVAELGLDSNATPQDIVAERQRRELAAAINELGLNPGSSWSDVGKARIRMELGLRIDASDDDVRIASSISELEDWANARHTPAAPSQEKGPNESIEDWRNRTQMGSSG